jgi:hypothetical protein
VEGVEPRIRSRQTNGPRAFLRRAIVVSPESTAKELAQRKRFERFLLDERAHFPEALRARCDLAKTSNTRGRPRAAGREGRAFARARSALRASEVGKDIPAATSSAEMPSPWLTIVSTATRLKTSRTPLGDRAGRLQGRVTKPARLIEGEWRAR